MAGPEAAAAMAIGGAVTGGIAGKKQAEAQNAAIEAAIHNRIDIHGTQNKQMAQSLKLEKWKLNQAANANEARIRVLTGERGIGEAGTALALERQNELDRGVNQRIMHMNFRNQREMSHKNLQADVIRLSSSAENAGMAMLSGAAGGASTGLAIGGLATEAGLPELKPFTAIGLGGLFNGGSTG